MKWTDWVAQFIILGTFVTLVAFAILQLFRQ